MRIRVLVIGLVAAAVLAAVAGAAPRVDTVAGSGTGGYAGDGGAATAALLTAPSDVSVVPGGGGAYLIADTSNHRIRRVAPDGTITTVAGAGPITGQGGAYAGDGLPATDPAVRLNFPRGVSATADGGFLIADTSNHVIRRVSAAGIITTAAGIGAQPGDAGDGGPATGALLNAPQGVAATPDGGFLIADTGNNRVRRVDATGGIVASASLPSNGAGFSGDGGPATAARLAAPSKVAVLSGGAGYLIADTTNNRIRRVSAQGIIDTVAGGGPVGAGIGDGGPATSATLNLPEGVAPTAAGGLLIADTGAERVRVVAPDGTIATRLGTGTLGLSGDGGDPAAAQVSHPRGLAEFGTGFLVADAFNHRIRGVSDPAAAGPGTPPASGSPPSSTVQAPPVIGATPPPGVTPPVLGRSAIASVTSGTIRIRRPGTRAFVVLAGAESIAMGTEVDARAGTVALFFVTTNAGRTASASIGEGRVLVTQPPERDGTQRPGRLTLSGPLAKCKASIRRAVSDGPPAGRRVRVRAKGRIKTQGRYGSAIVRGTRWIMVDRCGSDPQPGTLTAVQEGVVAVRDFALRKTFRVRAGERYLANPPGAARRG